MNPTRMELTNLKRKLVTARRGHKLLKDKRDELMRQFLLLVKENKELRKSLEMKIKKASAYMALASGEMSDNEISVALMLSGQKLTVDVENKNISDIDSKVEAIGIKELSDKLQVGEVTLKDIIAEIKKPGRDPREEGIKPILRIDVLKIEDITEGMILKGTVRNVVDFGAFVDIGIKNDGLVHKSEMSKRPYDSCNCRRYS